MHAQSLATDGAKNTASRFYRVNREADDDRAERVRSLHERFVHRAALRAAWDAQECRDIRAAHALRLWEECGCVHLNEYLMRTCGFTRREASERVRVAMALGELPRLEDELEAGHLAYSSVRELVRVVVAEKQDEWIAHCAGMNSDQVARAVSGHKRGDSPDDRVDPDEHRITVSYSLRDSTRARFAAAVRALATQRGHDFVDDDDLFQTLADVIDAHVGAAVNQPAANDNDHDPDTTRPGHDADGSLPTRNAMRALRKALSRPPVHVWLLPDGRAFANDAELPPAERDALLCDSVQMGNVDDARARPRKRLSDRERARTYAQHGNQCAVPGCEARTHLDIHHIVHLENGGLDVPANRVPLCAGHHRLHHAGKLAIAGHAPYGLTFQLTAPPTTGLDV